MLFEYVCYASCCLFSVTRFRICSCECFFFLMIRRPPRSTQSRSSAASDVYKRQVQQVIDAAQHHGRVVALAGYSMVKTAEIAKELGLSLIHISEPTRLLSISYAVFCLKKKTTTKKKQTETRKLLNNITNTIYGNK